MGTLAAPTVTVSRLSLRSLEPQSYNLVMAWWSITFFGAKNIFQFGFIEDKFGTTRSIVITKHAPYISTYTPREPLAASPEATTPNLDFFRIFSRFIV